PEPADRTGRGWDRVALAHRARVLRRRGACGVGSTGRLGARRGRRCGAHRRATPGTPGADAIRRHRPPLTPLRGRGQPFSASDQRLHSFLCKVIFATMPDDVTGWSGTADTVRLDARSVRGLAHPLRLKLLGLLRTDGPATS